METVSRHICTNRRVPHNRRTGTADELRLNSKTADEHGEGCLSCIRLHLWERDSRLHSILNGDSATLLQGRICNWPRCK